VEEIQNCQDKTADMRDVMKKIEAINRLSLMRKEALALKEDIYGGMDYYGSSRIWEKKDIKNLPRAVNIK